MRNVLLIGVALSLLSFGCGDNEKKGCDDSSDRDQMAADVTEESAKECYTKCIHTDMSEVDCKKACYGDWTKGDKCKEPDSKCGKDVDAGSIDTTSVDASSDVTGTDAVNIPGDVTPQG